MGDIERWAIYRNVHDGSEFVEGDKSVTMSHLRPAEWERIEVVEASHLEGAVEENEKLREALKSVRGPIKLGLDLDYVKAAAVIDAALGGR